MRYHFKYRNGVKEMWELAMIYQYSSLVGVVNVVFTFAMAVLAGASYGNHWMGWLIVSAIGTIYFPLIQPLIIFARCRKNAVKIQEDTELAFSEEHIYITVGEQHQTLTWKEIYAVRRFLNLTVLYTGRGHGLVIPGYAFQSKEESKSFLQFAEASAVKAHPAKKTK